MTDLRTSGSGSGMSLKADSVGLLHFVSPHLIIFESKAQLAGCLVGTTPRCGHPITSVVLEFWYTAALPDVPAVSLLGADLWVTTTLTDVLLGSQKT